MRISDWSSDVCSSDLTATRCRAECRCRRKASRRSSPGSARSRSKHCPARLRPAAPGAARRHRTGKANGRNEGVAAGENRTFAHLIASEPCRSEEHTSELQSLMRISYAVFCLKKKKILTKKHYNPS